MSIVRDSMNEGTLTALAEQLKSWDERFLQLEEEVRASRAINNSDSLSISPITPQEPRSLAVKLQPIK
jgi:hypothetical protein